MTAGFSSLCTVAHEGMTKLFSGKTEAVVFQSPIIISVTPFWVVEKCRGMIVQGD